MKKIIFLFCFMLVSFSGANHTPLRISSYIIPDSIFKLIMIDITALDDNIVMEDVTLNRSNCNYHPNLDIFSFKLIELFPRKLNYSDTITLETNCNKILEIEVITNIGNYTFKN